jgi:hypothetical protein
MFILSGRNPDLFQLSVIQRELQEVIFRMRVFQIWMLMDVSDAAKITIYKLEASKLIEGKSKV